MFGVKLKGGFVQVFVCAVSGGGGDRGKPHMIYFTLADSEVQVVR